MLFLFLKKNKPKTLKPITAKAAKQEKTIVSTSARFFIFSPNTNIITLLKNQVKRI
jgi:hypothetical protein